MAAQSDALRNTVARLKAAVILIAPFSGALLQQCRRPIAWR